MWCAVWCVVWCAVWGVDARGPVAVASSDVLKLIVVEKAPNIGAVAPNVAAVEYDQDREEEDDDDDDENVDDDDEDEEEDDDEDDGVVVCSVV